MSAEEEFECQKCGKITPVRVCPNCGLGTRWKHVHARGRGLGSAAVTHLEIRHTAIVYEFDLLIVTLSTITPIYCFYINPLVAVLLGILVGWFNWFLGPYARTRILQIWDASVASHASKLDGENNPSTT
jgi:hypothetical protein